MRHDSTTEIFRAWASNKPNKIAYRFLADGDNETHSLTYQELDTKARAIAAHLQKHLSVGDRVILLYPQGLDYVTAFWACLYAGVIAVPAFPPRSRRQAPRVFGIIDDVNPGFILSTGQQIDALQKIMEPQEHHRWQWLNTETISDDLAEQWTQADIGGDDVAFLQYTSGSTGTPKGVMITQGNLLTNEQMIQKNFAHSEDTVMISWLPLFHDMGLMSMIQAAFVGGSMVIMSPLHVIQKPIRWLRAVTRFNGTTTGAPNFAYDLCVDEISDAEKQELNLSSLDIAYNGSEPVRKPTIERFNKAFKDFGLKQSAMFPCYGMAETTLMVSSSTTGNMYISNEFCSESLKSGVATTAGKDGKQSLVSSGSSRWEEQIIKIVNPESRQTLKDGEVGEIWISGGHIAVGYWQRPEQSNETFANYLDGHKDPFLRTGDLGFMKEGELFVTGRSKDVIIVRGRNYYPQDIEQASEDSHNDVRRSGVVAFSYDDAGQEKVIICQELEKRAYRNPDVDTISASIRKAVWDTAELDVDEIILLKPAAIPKTSSGKVQRQRVKASYLANELTRVATWTKTEGNQVTEEKVKENKTEETTDNTKHTETANSLQQWLIGQVAEISKLPAAKIDPQQPFSTYGLGSLEAVQLTSKLSDYLEREVSPTLAYDYPSINEIVKHIHANNSAQIIQTEQESQSSPTEPDHEDAIAIVGAECRFPGAENIDKFWELLELCQDAISDVPPTRWNSDEWYSSKQGAVGKMSTRRGGFIDGIDLFDNGFFDISPKEAEMMDPQQRLLLETSWHTLERAHTPADLLSGQYGGIFVGISSNDYSRNALSDRDAVNAYAVSGNALSIAANRLSYFLNWKGPSMAIDTACSSSLVAIHKACQSLRNNECNFALAGGVNAIVAPEITVAFSQAQMMAPDGRCKTFDKSADGYVRGEGCGMVLLKRLADAKRDGDNILAIIRGSAINQDGRSNGLTAPNSQSQQEVILRALANSKLSAENISYIETHGTGTSLGDPIEINVLSELFANNASCHIGSVKSNIGHLESAAGIAGLLKVMLAMQHRRIPGQVNFSNLNPAIRLGGALKIPTTTEDWSSTDQSAPLRAGVSAFGFGGSNAHVVLEEASPSPTTTATAEPTSASMLLLSAKQENGLKQLADKYHTVLKQQPDISVAELAATAHLGRSHLTHRLALVANSNAQMQEQLQAYLGGSPFAGANGSISRAPGALVFLCTGQGSQYSKMGMELYDAEPVYKSALDHCNEITLEEEGYSLLEVLQGEGDQIGNTQFAQTALFSVEYALYKLWQSRGINPDALIGHSLGEYVAACIAGVFSLRDALKLVCTRGRLMASTSGEGAMIALNCTTDSIASTLEKYKQDISIAAINTPDGIVVSGFSKAIDSFLNEIDSGIKRKALAVSHAFHSPQMHEILNQFRELASTISYTKPKLPLVSNIGGQIVAEELCNADYWVNHIAATVNFQKGIETLLNQGYNHFLEIGPNPILSPMVQKCVDNLKLAEPVKVTSSLRKGTEEHKQSLQAAAELYAQGFSVAEAFFKEKPNRQLTLPLMPFCRNHFWLQVKHLPSAVVTTTKQMSSFSYQVRWKQAPSLVEREIENKPWIILSNGSALGNALANKIQVSGQTVSLLRSNKASAQKLQKLTEARDFEESRVIYLWGLEQASESDAFEFTGGLKLAEFIRTLDSSRSNMEFWGITQGAIALESDKKQELEQLQQAGLWAYWRGLMQELPALRGGLLDLESQLSAEALAEIVFNEIVYATKDCQLALRGGRRYTPVTKKRITPISESRFDPAALYMVTGGFGGIAKQLVDLMIKRGAKNFILTSREQLPARKSWRNKKLSDSVKEKISYIKQLETSGVKVTSLQLDVSDVESVEDAFKVIKCKRIPLKGIIHCAGQSNIEKASSINPDTFAKTVAPKVLGSWNLHQASANFKLDYFILCSSIAGSLGSPGQVFYGAANAFMDALAQYRCQQNLPALSINWGPWDDVGMYRKALDSGERFMLDAVGINSLAPADYLPELESALSADISQIMIADIQWETYNLFLANTVLRDTYTHLVPAKKEVEEVKPTIEASTPLLKRLQSSLKHEQISLLVDTVQREVADILKMPELPDPEALFDSLGMDSLTAVEMKQRLETMIGQTISASVTYNYPNINLLCQYLLSEVIQLDDAKQQDLAKQATSNFSDNDKIAIIGYSCRFPGDAENPESFWDLLNEGRDAITRIPAMRWDNNEYYDPTPGTPGKTYTRHGCFVKHPDQFAANFFNVSAREAIAMDPQHRLLMEVSWEALENSGINTETLTDTDCGIFVGIGQNDYSNRKNDINAIDVYDGTGNGFCFAAGRLAHVLGTRGPVMSVDTACSSSLSAIHLACQSLRSGESDICIGAGVHLILSPEVTVFLSQSRALTANNRYKIFDAESDGFMRGEGCGVVILKRLSNAQRDGDRIHAVICGSAMNHDGKSRGLTVPNGTAQLKVIQDALRNSTVDATTIDYVEAHGTGTELGDPIELEALSKVYGSDRESKLAVGSLKANIGHLEAAAGIAGVIKCILSLQHQSLPKQVHFDKPNPHVDWDNNNIEIMRENKAWLPQANRKRRAAVSAFGLSGTNVHMLLEEPDQHKEHAITQTPEPAILQLTAKTETELSNLAASSISYIERYKDQLPQYCHKANASRQTFSHRFVAAANNDAELIGKLQNFVANDSSAYSYKVAKTPRVAFAFTGQGSQYSQMGYELYQSQPKFAEVIDYCDSKLRDELPISLKEVLFNKEYAADLNRTRYTQPALFAIGYALAKLLQYWGIQPQAVLGHSVGEITAACLAEVMSLDEALTLISTRARLIDSLPDGGGMSVVFTDVDTVASAMAAYSDVDVAAVNAPNITVISGASDSINAVSAQFKKQGIKYSPLTVSHAFHSSLMEPILNEFETKISHIAFKQPKLHLISNLTGKQQIDIPNAKYWRQHIREAVQFFTGIDRLAAEVDLIIELGPMPTLSNMGKLCTDQEITWLNTLNRKQNDSLYAAIAAAARYGCAIDWNQFYQTKQQHPMLELPVYPFNRERYWIDTDIAPNNAISPIETNENTVETFQIDWQAYQPHATDYSKQQQPWLIYATNCQASKEIVQALEQHSTYYVLTPKDSVLVTDHTHIIDPVDPASISSALYDIGASHLQNCQVLYLGGLKPSSDMADAIKQCGGYDLSALIGQLQQLAIDFKIHIVTQGALEVQGRGCQNLTHMLQAPLWSYWRSMVLELPQTQAAVIDLDPMLSVEKQIPDLLNSLAAVDAERQLVMRDGQYFVPRLQKQANAQAIGAKSIVTDASYIITGGLGGIGLQIAQQFIHDGAQNILLFTRRNPKDLDENTNAKLEQLRASGARADVIQVDISSDEDLHIAIDSIMDCYPAIKGVVHAAGVVSVSPIETISEDEFQKLFQPKVVAGWNLHRATEKLDLDFFVNCSSISATLGTKHLAHYAAANAFLDALSSYQRQQGRTSLSINWGPWSDVGMLTSYQQQHSAFDLSASGIIPNPASSYLPIFKRCLSADCTSLAVADIDWSTLTPLISLTQMKSFYTELMPASETSSTIDEHKTNHANSLWIEKAHSLSESELLEQVNAALSEQLRQSLQLPQHIEIDVFRPFNELGMDSLVGVQYCENLSKHFAIEVPAVSVFEYPTISELAEHICGVLTKQASQKSLAVVTSSISRDEPIAVIGMDCILPSADNPEEFWNMLIDGNSALKPITRKTWQNSNKDDIAVAALIERPYRFDPGFFGISPHEAQSMDPQQRLFMQVAWRALEQSGYGGSRIRRQTGIYVGSEHSNYSEHYLAGQYFQQIHQQLSATTKFDHIDGNTKSELLAMLAEIMNPSEVSAETAPGVGLNEIAARMSHFLNLKGPSMVLNSACSSAIVALDTACNHLRSGHVEMAVVGGVNLCLSDTVQEFMKKAGALSETGYCAPFDENADGMLLGEGVGAIILKPLSQAIADKDHIVATIREVNINNDGHSQGITVPNPQGQAECIRQAYERSGIDPRSVSYIEAHGTGTSLGDPIEIQSLTQAFRSYTDDTNFCKLGSVKSLIGHTLASSGMAGIIKVCLALKNKQLPPSVNYRKANPHIAFEDTPFSVQENLTNWDSSGQPLRAGLNSFGFGGTNAHVILEEAPARDSADNKSLAPVMPLILQAQSENSFPTLAEELVNFIIQHPELPVENVVAIKNRNQRKMQYKRIIPYANREELTAKLRSIANSEDIDGIFSGRCHPKKPKSLVWAAKCEPLAGDLMTQLQQNTTFASAYQQCQQLGTAYNSEKVHAFASAWALACTFSALGIKPSKVVAVTTELAAALTGAINLPEGLSLYCEAGSPQVAHKHDYVHDAPFAELNGHFTAASGYYSTVKTSEMSIISPISEKDLPAHISKNEVMLFWQKSNAVVYMEDAKISNLNNMLNAISVLLAAGVDVNFDNSNVEIMQYALPNYFFNEHDYYARTLQYKKASDEVKPMIEEFDVHHDSHLTTLRESFLINLDNTI